MTKSESARINGRRGGRPRKLHLKPTDILTPDEFISGLDATPEQVHRLRALKPTGLIHAFDGFLADGGSSVNGFLSRAEDFMDLRSAQGTK